MKVKRTHKGQYKKPQPLFHLTWKFKALKLTFHVTAFTYKVGCHVEHLVGSSFHRLLHILHLCHRTDLHRCMATCTTI
jgi:hypothetical protein